LEWDSGEVSFVYGVFMDSKNFFFPWHSYGCFADEGHDTLKGMYIYPDIPQDGMDIMKARGQDITRVAHKPEKCDDTRDLGVIRFFKAQPGYKELWNNVPPRDKVSDGTIFEDAFRVIRTVAGGKQLVLAEGPFSMKFHLVSNKRLRLNHQYGSYLVTDLSYYVATDAGGRAGECGFPYVTPNMPHIFRGLHGGAVGVDAFVIPIFAEDKDATFDLGTLQSLLPGVPVAFPSEKAQDAPHIPGALFVGEWMGKLTTCPPESEFRPLTRCFIDDPEMRPLCHAPAIVTKKAQMNRFAKTHATGMMPIIDDPLLRNKDFLDGFVRDTNYTVLPVDIATFGGVYQGKEYSSMASSSKMAGWPWLIDKKDIIDFDKKWMHPCLRARIEWYELVGMEGPVHPVVQTFSKDELLEVEKIMNEICRNVNGHDFAYNVHLRRYGGGVLTELVDHPIDSPCAIGINPFSAEWGIIDSDARRFAYDGDGNIAGDLKTQETSMGLNFAEAFEHAVAFKTHFEEKHVHVPKNIVDSLSTPLGEHIDPLKDPSVERVVVRVDERKVWKNTCQGLSQYYFVFLHYLYLCTYGHSSGHYYTTLYNSFMVWIGHKYIFARALQNAFPSDHSLTPKKISSLFKQYVSLKVGGDDSKGSVHEQYRDIFNMQVIAKGFMQYFGVTYTSPDKKQEIIPKFIDPKDDNFLGRTTCVMFKYDKLTSNDHIECVPVEADEPEEVREKDVLEKLMGFDITARAHAKTYAERTKYGTYTVGRLRMTAILGMLNYWKPVSGMTKKQVIQQRLDACCRELCLYPKVTFDLLIQKFLREHLRKPWCPTIQPHAYYRNLVFSNWYRNDYFLRDEFVDYTDRSFAASRQ
jgi:hypothetical protein